MASDWPSGRYPSDIDTYKGIPDIYSARTIDAVMNNLVSVGAVDVTWKAELAMGELLYIPVMTSLSAAAVNLTEDWGTTRQANMNTTQFTTAETITVDQWWECPLIIDDGSLLQTQIPNLLEKGAKRAGYEIAKKIDTEVNTQFKSLTGTWQGTDGQTFADDLLIALMEGLDEADVPRSERSLVIDPSVLADMYRIDKFVHKDYNQTLTGEIGRTPYGDTILMTNNLEGASTGNYGALLHREAIGAVIQMPPKVVRYRWEPMHSWVVNVSAIYGADVVRATFGVEFYTRDKA